MNVLKQLFLMLLEERGHVYLFRAQAESWVKEAEKGMPGRGAKRAESWRLQEEQIEVV